MKNIVLVAILVMYCGFAFADITDILNQTWTEEKQREAAFAARAILQRMNNEVNYGLNQLQAIKDSGHFDTLPADLKQALNRWWQIYKDAKSAFQTDAELLEIYQWSPSQ